MGIRVGMIGLTHPHSAMYLRTLESLAAVSGVVLCDPEATARERVVREYPKAVGAVADLEALLSLPDVPVLLVTLPTNQVPDVLVRAARAGKHLICEKPCARSAEEFRPVLAALAAGRVQLTTAYLWRAHPAMLKMRELVNEGALGRLTSVELRMVTTQIRLRDPSHWLFRRDVAGGGILTWLGCHWLDLLRYLTGEEVTQVSATLATLSGEAIDVEDVASVSMRLTGGAVASLYAGYLLSAGNPGYEGASYDQAIILRGTLGTLSYQRDAGDHLVKLESIAAGWQAAPWQTFRFTLPVVPAYGGAHGLKFVDEFLRFALTGEGENLVSPDDAMRLLEILDAAYLSARSGAVADVRRREDAE